MMNYTDMHCHMLFGVDDGAKTREDMQVMLDMAYADGTKRICFTPHYHPGYYGENGRAAFQAFEKAEEYAALKYPDLRLHLGNELHYDQGCREWIADRKVRTINGSRYLLVDFSDNVPAKTVLHAMDCILNFGCRPVIAHIEAYSELRSRLDDIRKLREIGVVIQCDSQSILGDFGMGAKRASRKLLAYGLVDVISSDSHNVKTRPPVLSGCFEYVSKKFGADYAGMLFDRNPGVIIDDGDL